MISTRLHYQLYVTIFLALLIVVAATIGLSQLTGRKNDAQIFLESVGILSSRAACYLPTPIRSPAAGSSRIYPNWSVSTLPFSGADNRLIDAVGRWGRRKLL